MDAGDQRGSGHVLPDYHFGLITEAAPVALCVIDGETRRFRWANGAMLELLGPCREEPEISGRALADVLPESVGGGLAAAVAAVADGSSQFATLECEFNRGSELRCWSWSLRPLGRLKGAAADVVAAVWDVTASTNARVLAEDEAARFEIALKRSSGVFANVGVGLAVFDTSGRLVYANDAASDLGVRHDQLVESDQAAPAALLTTVDGEEVLAEDRPLAHALRGQSFDGRRLKRVELSSGRTHYLSYGGAPVRDEGGRVILAALTLRDIHEAMEEHLQREMLLWTLEREQKRSSNLLATIESERDVLQLVMEGTDTQLAYLDAELRFVVVNDAFVSSSGMSRDGLLGRKHLDALPPEVAGRALHQALADGVTVRSQRTSRRGFAWTHERHAEWTITPVPGAPLPTEGLVFSLRDITSAVRAEQLSEALNAINLTLSRSLRTQEVLQQLVGDATAALGCDAGAVALRDGDAWQVRHVMGLPEELLGSTVSETACPPGGLCARVGVTVSVDDALADTSVDVAVGKRWGVRAAVGIPFMVRGSCEGMLLCFFRDRPHEWLEVEVDFATKLAASAALAFENSRLYETEHMIAHTLQESLLSMPSAVEGVRFGHLYRSAQEAARVGGDFYDVFSLGVGRVGLVIGDVSGKGLEAAALTSLVRETIKAHSSPFVSPAAVVARANEVILHNCDAETFVTVFYGVLDVATGHLEYCSAGHPPPALKRAATASLLMTRSPLVGALDCVSYRSEGISISERDVLLLYTDGLVEAHRGHEMYGEHRVLSSLAKMGGAAAEDIPEAMFMDAFTWTGGALRDDVAIVAVSLDPDRVRGVAVQPQLPLEFG